ncbi:unnamed protein product, partial [Ectocarpus sp. 8 AP-2014]
VFLSSRPDSGRSCGYSWLLRTRQEPFCLRMASVHVLFAKPLQVIACSRLGSALSRACVPTDIWVVSTLGRLSLSLLWSGLLVSQRVKLRSTSQCSAQSYKLTPLARW